MVRLGNEAQLKTLPNTIEAWVEPFARIGISTELLQEAFPVLPLPNLFELYQNAESLFFLWDKKVEYHTTWQLHCLTPDRTLTEAELAQFEYSRDNLRRIPLHYLAFTGSIQAIQIVFKAYPYAAYSTDEKGGNSLHFAALSGSPQVIQSVLDNYPKLAKSTDTQGRNLLHFAALSGSLQAVQFVLDNYPDLADSTDKSGMNLLHFAALSGSPQAIQFVLDNYPKLAKSTDTFKRNTLLIAALSGSPQSIQLVLDKSPELAKSTDKEGRNILHHAAWSGSFQAIHFLLTTYPQLTATLWVKDQYGDTPDSYAKKKMMSPSPREIKRTLFAEITTDILNQKRISENLIDFLDAFHGEWQSFLIDSNSEDLPQAITRLPQYVPEKLLPHINHIQELIDLKGYSTQPHPPPLSENCLETIISLATPAEKQVRSTLWLPRKSTLLKTLQKLLGQWRMSKSKDTPDLNNKIARTIKVIIEDHLRAPIRKDTSKLDSLIIRALRAIPEIAAFNPSNKVAEGMDISPDNYQRHFDAVMQALPSVVINEDTRRIITETLLPGIQHLITDQDKIIQHVIDHYGQLYYLSEDLPLHTDHADHNKPEEFRATLNRILVDFFGMFYTCQKAGRLPDLFSKLSSGYCLEGRIRDTLEWTTSLADLKDFASFMAEVTADYEAYQTIMLGKTSDKLQPALKFIMERFKDLPCKEDREYAPNGKIQKDKVREYLLDILVYKNGPDSGCVIS